MLRPSLARVERSGRKPSGTDLGTPVQGASLVHEKGVFAFKRYDDKHSAVTVVNDGNQIYTMELDGKYTSLLTGAVYKDSIDILPMTCDVLISDVED